MTTNNVMVKNLKEGDLIVSPFGGTNVMVVGSFVKTKDETRVKLRKESSSIWPFSVSIYSSEYEDLYNRVDKIN